MTIESRAISSATERYVRKVAEDVTSIQSNVQILDHRSQQNHQEMKTWQVKAEQKKQGKVSFKTIKIKTGCM